MSRSSFDVFVESIKMPTADGRACSYYRHFRFTDLTSNMLKYEEVGSSSCENTTRVHWASLSRWRLNLGGGDEILARPPQLPVRSEPVRLELAFESPVQISFHKYKRFLQLPPPLQHRAIFRGVLTRY